MNKYVASAPVIEYAPAPDVHAAPALVNEPVASSPVIEYVIATLVQCPQWQFIEKTVEIPDFLLCQGTQTAESIACVAPAKYNAPALTMAHRVHGAPALVVENEAAPSMAYLVHAAPAPVVENAPAPDVAYRAHAAPDPEVEYIAAAGYAGPAPDEEKYFISITRLEEVNYAALTI